jgi:hypothetical protein
MIRAKLLWIFILGVIMYNLNYAPTTLGVQS